MITAASLVSVVACAAWAHPGTAHSEAVQSQWSWEPVAVLTLAVTMLFYLLGLRGMRRAGALKSLRSRNVLAFIAGWIALVIALLSPVHRMGSISLAVHMVQHELLMLVAAPLLVLGQPLLVFLWAFPLATRERIGQFLRRPWPALTWKAVSAPLVVWLMHALALWIWHTPSLYAAALHNESVHIAQHTAFLLTALLFWWTLIHGRYGRLGYGAALVYVFTTAMHSGALGALLTMAPNIIYPDYNHATLLGMTPLEDQQLAGLIMWVPAGVILLTIGLALALAWMAESDRRVRYSSAAALAGETSHHG